MHTKTAGLDPPKPHTAGVVQPHALPPEWNGRGKPLLRGEWGVLATKAYTHRLSPGETSCSDGLGGGGGCGSTPD